LINRRLKRSISRSVQIIRSSTLRSSHLEKRSKWHLLIGTIFPLDDEHKSSAAPQDHAPQLSFVPCLGIALAVIFRWRLSEWSSSFLAGEL
jgi:hypothetical protein